MLSFVDILEKRIEADPSLTAAGLAKRAGLDNSTIRTMIRDRRSPRIDTALKICQALGETVESFMSQSRDPVTSERGSPRALSENTAAPVQPGTQHRFR